MCDLSPASCGVWFCFCVADPTLIPRDMLIVGISYDLYVTDNSLCPCILRVVPPIALFQASERFTPSGSISSAHPVFGVETLLIYNILNIKYLHLDTLARLGRWCAIGKRVAFMSLKSSGPKT